MTYDEWCDNIICSDGFRDCKNKDKEDNCLEYFKLKRCWHIRKCPKNINRGVKE